MPGALAVVKFSGRKSSDRKCSNNDLKEIFAKSNSISWGEFLRSSDRKCHTYGLKETVVKSNAYSQEQNFKGENGGGICQNKNTKCPIDAHCTSPLQKKLWREFSQLSEKFCAKVEENPEAQNLQNFYAILCNSWISSAMAMAMSIQRTLCVLLRHGAGVGITYSQFSNKLW